MRTLRIYVLDGNCHLKPVNFKINLLLLGGWSGRNQTEVKKHIEELAKTGVPKPKKTPIVFPVSTYLINTLDEVEVQHKFTNGEVEYVLFVDENIKYVTVGSDHTDRSLEKLSVEKAKQAYPKIIAPIVWRYKDVEGHWDKIILKSIIKLNGEKILYQKSALKTLLPPKKFLEIVDRDKLSKKGLIIFSGTIPTVTGKLQFPESFQIEMIDPVLKRCISYQYRIKVLPSIT